MYINDDDGLGELEVGRKGILLVDADTLAYTACLECEVTEELLPLEFYSAAEWSEITETPGYDENTHCIYSTDYDILLEKAKTRVATIMYETNTKSCELYFSSGSTFRHKLVDTYKNNRASLRYPTGLGWLKSELLNHYDGAICKGHEADDEVVFRKRHYPLKYVLAAIDKDVLNSVVGTHFDYYHARMCFVTTTAETAVKWPYLQCLMGDPADNIPGVRGIGKKRAEALLENLLLPIDLWKKVVEVYTQKANGVKEAIETMRLVNMHQLQEDGKVQLWSPPM